MVEIGSTTSSYVDQAAGNLVKLGRARTGVTQRGLAVAAGVPQSTVARVESGVMQPSLPMLYRLLAAMGLEPRIRLEKYDDHDDVLDALTAADPDRQGAMERDRDATLNALGQAR